MPLETNEVLPAVPERTKSYKVMGHIVFNDDQKLMIQYVEGETAEGVFKPTSQTKTIDISDEAFLAMLGRNPELYGILKGVLYLELMLALGVSGDVV